jgi:Na+/H+-dicarboxylate symporter
VKLWQKVLIGLCLGVVVGWILQDDAVHLKIIGDIFIRLIKMIIVPLIFCAVVNGIVGVGANHPIGRIGRKAAIMYCATTVCAVMIGFTSALLFKPGLGIHLPVSAKAATTTHSAMQKILDPLLQIIPENVVKMMAEGNALQVVFFAIFLALVIRHMGESGRPATQFFKALAPLIFKMIELIVQLSPYAAFAFVASLVGTQGVSVLSGLGRLLLAAAFAFGFQYLLFGGMIYVFGGLNPIPFYRKSIEYQLVAISTSSTKAALPVTIRVCREKMGISEASSSFILPLGASINMDGLAIYLGLCAIFVAQAAGVSLSWLDYGLIIVTATLGSIGGAGIPSAALMMLPIILQAVHLPIEGVVLITGIDRIMDMVRSMISITGDAAVTLTVDQTEGQLDQERYHAATQCHAGCSIAESKKESKELA